MIKTDVAAYVWPSYTGDEFRARQFWPQGFGEWESVIAMKPKFEGHLWPRKPLWGYVNEADPRIMEMQIKTAVEYGVNVFIYDWYWYDRRPFLEHCLNNGFLKASNNESMQFYLMWANHNANYLWDRRNSHLGGMWDDENAVWLAAQDKKEFEIIVRRIIERYFSRPNYYKINNKPVFSIFDTRNLIKGFGGAKETFSALDWFRNETVKAGHSGLHLQAVIGSNPKNPVNVDGKEYEDTVAALGYDSVTNYQFINCTNSTEKTVDYNELLGNSIAPLYEKLANECTTQYFPHVSIGWDNNIRFKDFNPPVYINNKPENFERGLLMAKTYLDKRPELQRLVTINSWNEWTEGSYLEPDDLYGYGYLEAVKKVFGGD